MRQTILLFSIFAFSCGSASISLAQEAQSQKPEDSRECIAVLGAVRMPGRFESKRRIRLLEAIAFAGGFTEQAGGTIEITHTGAKCPLAADRDIKGNAPISAPKVSYQKASINTNDEALNPFLEAGDIVVVSEVAVVYVVGHVANPRQTFLQDKMTLTQAIDSAGGALKDALIDRVRIIRQTPNAGELIEIKVDLKKVRKKKIADPVLQPNDIIEVPPRHGMSGPLVPVRPIYDAPPPVRVIY
jgi:polysaccharide export outer membrane protein